MLNAKNGTVTLTTGANTVVNGDMVTTTVGKDWQNCQPMVTEMATVTTMAVILLINKF